MSDYLETGLIHTPMGRRTTGRDATGRTGYEDYGLGTDASRLQGGADADRRGGSTLTVGAVGVEDDSVARFLGFFSLALGAAQLSAPKAMAQLVGLEGDERDRQVMLALGLREMASGLGILATDRMGRRPTGWLWARVGGDVMDLAMLAGATTSRRADPGRLAMAGAAVLGVLALDMLSAQRHSAMEDGDL
jgi:hypothetical protein